MLCCYTFIEIIKEKKIKNQARGIMIFYSFDVGRRRSASRRNSKFSPSLCSTSGRQRVLLNLAKLPCNHLCRLLMFRVVDSTVQWHAGRWHGEARALKGCRLMRLPPQPQIMPNAFVSLVLVVLCAAAYMHFFQPTDNLPPATPAPHPSAPSPSPPYAQASKPEALTSPHTSTTPQETPTCSLSAEARRVQNIIDQKVKEAGGPQYVTKLDLVSARASNMKRDKQ